MGEPEQRPSPRRPPGRHRARKRGAGRAHPPRRTRARRGDHARRGLRRRHEGRPQGRRQVAARRLRHGRPGLRPRLDALPALAEAPAALGAALLRAAQALRAVGDGAGRPRGQAEPRRLGGIPHDAVGVGHADPGGQGDLRPVPPGLAARLLPRGHRTAGGRRRGRHHAPGGLPVARPEAGRLLVAEHPGGRHRVLDEPAAGRGGPAGGPGVVARARRPVRLGARAPGGRLHRGQRPEDRAGALGEPGRLVPQHDRHRDRRPGVRGGHRPPERRPGVRGALGGRGRRLAVEGGELDGHRPTGRTPPTPTTCA